MFFFLKKSFSILKKVILIIIVFSTVISLFIYFVNKDKPKIAYDSIQKNRQEIYKTLNDKKIGSTKEEKLALFAYKIILCKVVGEACTNNPLDGDNNYYKSLFGYIGNMISFTYTNPPASGIYWAYSSLQNAGFVPKTYAAEGIGFSTLKPLMNLWKLMRDIAYMLLVIVFIVIGFMVMFRMKLNPQTVINVENALPKIVISLLLITFSFAIAGFLIDLMYILIAIIIAILGDNNINYNIAKYQQDFVTAGPGKLIIATYYNPLIIGNALLNLLPSVLNIGVRVISMLITLRLANTLFGLIYPGAQIFDNMGIATGIIGKFPSGIIFWILLPLTLLLGFALIPQVIIFILIIVTLLLLFFRIFFMLFKSYLQIIIWVIFSPIILIFEAVPGKGSFSFWFKNLLAEVLTFPIVITLLIIGEIIAKTMAAPGTFWTPPFITGINPEAYGIIVGTGIFFIIPDIVQLVKQQLLGVKGLGFEIGPGVFFGGAGTVLGGGAGLLGQISSINLGLSAISGVQNPLAGAIKKMNPFAKGTNTPQEIKTDNTSTG